MNDNLQQRLAQFSRLDCKVAKRFNDRPTLLDTAAYLLFDQWQRHHLSRQYDPLNLFLKTRHAQTDHIYTRPLAQVLVERYCRRSTLNLTVGADVLIARPDDDTPVAIDLHEVELLINQAGPLLLTVYQEQLTGYWSLFDSSGETPWQWYANHLRAQLQNAIDTHHAAGSLPGLALATAKLLHAYPEAAQRNAWPNAKGLVVSGLRVDYANNSNLDVDLASAVLIEHADGEPARDLTLLYTLSGKLLRFASRQDLLQTIARYHASTTPQTPLRIDLTPVASSVFEDQALGLLNQQLCVIETLAGRYHSALDAITLSLDIDRFTSMVDLCSDIEEAQRRSLSAHLPDWLRNAPSRPLMHYSTLLIDVAQRYQEAKGRFWLDGVPTAEAYANQQLARRLAADHPDAACNPEQVRVTNYQVTAAAAPVQGSLVTSGEVTPVAFSLAQLAIGNLGLLKPGRVTLTSTTADPLPAWMTEGYLRTLISELDIATTYPALLRHELLDDMAQRQQRQQLLKAQLGAQLPALAMALHLQGKIPDRQIVDHVSQVFSSTPSMTDSNWVMRPLGLVKYPGAAADYPRNTWLIEAQAPNGEACLLYRPLHEASLLYFSDRLALFVALSTEGELQDDLLQRLPAEDRRFYAHGGFLEPHLFAPLDDTSAVPFGTPAPVSLALAPAEEDVGQALYLACVNESIERFEAQAVSTSQTRWNSWKALGWLLFNTLLPLAGSTLGKVAWLAQMEIALARFITSDSQRAPSEHRLAMVDLLVNIAMLLFSHSLFRLRLEQARAGSPLAPPQLPRVSEVASPEVTTAHATLIDFSWSRPNRTLSPAQRQALEQLQAKIRAADLGSPIPAGELQGLYLHGAALYTVFEGKVYEVEQNQARQSLRIVGADQTPGPWLHVNEVGAWQLDLRLGLKGGMPLSEQLRRLQLEKQDALRAANDVIRADKALIPAKLREMTTLEGLTSATTDDSVLGTCQERISAVSSFWEHHLEHLKTRNALQVVKDFRKVHAYAVYNVSFCQRVLHKILYQRYQPNRAQLLQIARQQQQGQPLGTADVRSVTQRLDNLAPLLERMTDNNRLLRQCQDELGKLAGPRFPEISQWRDLAATVTANAERALVLRFLRLEGLLNRMTLVHRLQGDAPYWRDRFWDNIELGIAQRAKLFKLAQPDPEVSTRLLHSIKGHFEVANRQLGNLIELTEGDAARQTAQQLQSELDEILADVTRDLKELPDYPPVRTLAQLRSKVPGLIETAEHGVLLAEPRAEDANTVDLPGPDSKTPTRTYHLKQGNWVELKPAKVTQPYSERSLKRLLKDSSGLMSTARKELANVQQAGNRYLPVEIEESILHQQARLLEQVDAIEARLTQDNATDEGVKGLDAEGTAKALRALAEELQGKAGQLRMQAALTQRPRMSEVQLLIEQGQVQLAQVGPRVRLARVKGRPADFLDEYSISHDGKALWYAHFHYPTLEAAKLDFTAGHLKTLAQRHVAGQQVTEANGTTTEVYRAPITAAAASAYFFNL
ncbi:hypothetical protein [Pseudomonas muyukensis]|uniref:Uncharacterized protein n=1 Tax=Pseudomonas muyukensis TaxID=2842357 RepID=A0ABX8M574_9PSED|nr:hypothetical protein [Pseudomonas muyukensis]QXH34236.1 hypothetical protein KSS95_19070 [Pseudomonas muyukensis]